MATTTDTTTPTEQTTASSRAPLRAPRAPAVRLEDVRVEFATRREPLVALDGLSLEVAAGEVLAIVGPNGSGKSTLLRVIDGLLGPTSGRVEVEGRPVAGPDPAVGFVFQEPRLLAWRSTIDNVAYPLELRGVGRRERRARALELLRLVGIARAADLRPHELSGGMRQRAAIARALALEPSVLLLDEPFSALDALTRDRFNVELLRLWERTRTTILLVTHSIPEALFVADRVVVLTPSPGRVAGIVGSPLGRPRTLADLASPDLARAAAELRAGLLATTDDPSAEVTE
ncbi:MAG TPA: ATP-binding cassette domain-containing protein [Candidatus Limnocylindrales bacterium]